MKNSDDKLIEYLSTLERTNFKISDLIDINKVIKNIDKMEIHLNSLNFIIANDENEIIRKIKVLYSENKSCFQVIPLLLAERNNEREIKLNNNQIIQMKDIQNNLDFIISTFKESGLIELITRGKIKNFVDYLTGVEVGMDTNARKNRSGSINEKDIKKMIDSKLGKYKNLSIEYQVNSNNFLSKEIINHTKTKRFDVVIKNLDNNKMVFIESSFYNADGSKLYETAGSYEHIFQEINEASKLWKFIWVADGPALKNKSNILIRKIELNYLFNKSNFIKHIKECLDIK